MKRSGMLFAATLVLCMAAGVLAQGPPIPRSGPEHEILKRDVGVWDFTMEINVGPEMPPFSAMGVETNTLFADRWLLTESKYDMMGRPYEGHGISGYDPDKKAYVSVWADTMGTSLALGEAVFEAKTNTLTGWMEMRDPEGAQSKGKTVEEWPTPATRIVKIFQVAGDAQPFIAMKYKRRK